jgi:hypothetical protein
MDPTHLRPLISVSESSNHSMRKQRNFKTKKLQQIKMTAMIMTAKQSKLDPKQMLQIGRRVHLPHLQKIGILKMPLKRLL